MKQSIKVSLIVLICTFLVSCDSVKKYVDCLLSDDASRKDILGFLIDRDEKKLADSIKADAVCMKFKEVLEVDMQPLPIYQKNNQGLCSALNHNVEIKDQCSGFKEINYNQGPYYSDNTCLNSVAFESSDYKMFCDEVISFEKPRDSLGNAAAWTANDSPVGNSPSKKWTLPYGARLKIINEKLSGNILPYMKRVNYKTINNVLNSDGSVRGSGSCKLEMRVYKNDITATNLKPLISIHGGSWKFRLAGFPGMEASISHLTKQGFIVFAPFYRLIGDKEANDECNNVSWNEVVADVEDALKWVWENGEVLGAARGKPVALTGQSAGAHLSMWLLAHPESHNVPISRALLLYPPTDFNDFVSRAVEGGKYAAYTDGVKTFENYFGVEDISQVSEQALADNSFPPIVARNSEIPPVFIIHGVSDKTVPSMQSVRLCNAYDRSRVDHNYDIGPAENDGGDSENDIYMKKYSCGAQGKLYLLAEADHAFDFKCLPGVCFAGSDKSIPALRMSLKEGREWLLKD